MVGVEIVIVHVPECPNLELARARVLEAIEAAGVDASIHEVEVTTATAAEQAGMHGSPTILVDGRDPFSAAGAPASMSCRLYVADGRFDGAPPVPALIAAFAR